MGAPDRRDPTGLAEPVSKGGLKQRGLERRASPFASRETAPGGVGGDGRSSADLNYRLKIEARSGRARGRPVRAANPSQGIGPPQ